MAAGVAEGLLWGVFEGCISGCDMDIERRPYHKNCKCALHRSNSNLAGGFRSPARCAPNLSYPIRRSWSEGSLAMAASRCCSSSSSASPVVATDAGRVQLSFCIEYDDEEEEEEGRVPCKA